MIMGNYIRPARQLVAVMATEQPAGIDHLTVVPTNFDPDEQQTEFKERQWSEH